MVKILEHFGQPRSQSRCDPQQLLAIPCNMCHPEQLAGAAAEGVAEEVVELARSLRPDIHVGVRALQVKQAVERIGPELLVLEGFYALLAVQAPYSLRACEAPELTAWERARRRDLCSQVDLCITARADRGADEPHETAVRRALGEACGMELVDSIWRADVQTELRKRIGVPELARGFKDAGGAEVDVLLLPDEAGAAMSRGMLCIGDGWDVASAPAAGGDAGGGEKIQGKTVREWEAAQAEFADQPKLPSGWIRVKSRSSGEVYYFNKKTRESTFDMPEAALPAGWTKQVSKSTGKVYYFHAQKRLSQFDRPTA